MKKWNECGDVTMTKWNKYANDDEMKVKKLNEYADSEEKYDDDEDCFADILELFSNLPQFKLFQETQTNILKLFSICPNFCIFVHSD